LSATERLRLIELIQQGAAEFRDGLRASLHSRSYGRFGFLQSAFLHPEMARFPGRAVRDLDRWHLFELEHPKTFINMYEQRTWSA
jgi:hypothetical protein